MLNLRDLQSVPINTQAVQVPRLVFMGYAH